jgi:hypothetical protein
MRILMLYLLVAALLAAACHDHSSTGREPDEYIGCATDEIWTVFDDVTEIVSPADAPAITAPANASQTLSSQPVLFTWSVSPTIAGTAAGDIPMDCEQWNTGFSTLHEPPISGTVYDLQISVDGAVAHRALTTLQQWQASPAVWASFAGKTISVRIRRLVVLANDRKAGPFAPAAPATFKVGS